MNPAHWHYQNKDIKINSTKPTTKLANSWTNLSTAAKIALQKGNSEIILYLKSSGVAPLTSRAILIAPAFPMQPQLLMHLGCPYPFCKYRFGTFASGGTGRCAAASK
jgi:hypothetical protein